MNNIQLKPTQKFITFSKYNLVIHQDAQKALLIWHQFRPRMRGINIGGLDDYYRPPLRLVVGKDSTYYFFNEFRRFDEILIEETSLRQPCLVAAESVKDIKRLAWSEVVELAFARGTHHPEFFKAISNSAPKSIICELMNIDRLTVDSYCRFAGISQSAYEYQQCKVANDEAMLGLPKNLSWMDTSYGSH
ncbi:hypothetical protein IQ457_04650 [Psychrobacter sp. M9-54-1]|uniref:hypothetical protein n=1 Tax=Psychrobacter sp. M9-54-1 TaxID=2782386 RepID=UPI001909D8EA|nr:hypothetical protein [Psychrobacter sp. M9-54-1]MBK3393236.1 hypothetical protein [Psychrobacter sp. M9-54-1]